MSLISRIRSPNASISKVVNQTTKEKSTNETPGKVASNVQSEGILTETEDIDIESTATRNGFCQKMLVLHLNDMN